MANKNYYVVEKNIEKILRNNYTNFLDPNIYSKVKNKLKNYNYKTYYPYTDSEKVIIYTNDIPKIRLIEIISHDKLEHRSIMGSLFGLNIDSEMFGDIIITNNHYYIMVIENIYEIIMNELKMIGNKSIKLKEVELKILDNFKRNYQELEYVVPSLRIDVILTRILGKSRDDIKKLFLDDNIILNYEICKKINHILKENDIFSIRKYGKYKFIKVIKNTKKNKYIILINKYIDN